MREVPPGAGGGRARGHAGDKSCCRPAGACRGQNGARDAATSPPPAQRVPLSACPYLICPGLLPDLELAPREISSQGPCRFCQQLCREIRRRFCSMLLLPGKKNNNSNNEERNEKKVPGVLLSCGVGLEIHRQLGRN